MIGQLQLLSLRKPSPDTLASFHTSLAAAELAFTEKLRRNRLVDFQEHRLVLGTGEPAWEAAKAALQDWAMFPAPEFETTPQKQAIAVGANATVCVKIFPFAPLYMRCGSRVVEVFDDAVSSVRRFGFTYETLFPHLERGTETFLVEYDTTSQAVSYRIYSYAMPGTPLLYPLRPLIHYLQFRMKKISANSMRERVAQHLGANQ